VLSMEDKIKIFKALGNETRFKIFKNIFTGRY
jgi:ArsR family transcriptional regulator